MKDDISIQRIRKIRHIISEQHAHNPRKLVEYYVKRQLQHRDRFANLRQPDQSEESRKA